jgi:hypothetical protein
MQHRISIASIATARWSRPLSLACDTHMRSWKIDELSKQHPEIPPPTRTLDSGPRAALRRRVALLLGGSQDADDNWIIERLNTTAPTLVGIDANRPNFSVLAALPTARFAPPDELCLIFTLDRAFDEVDVVPTDFLDNHFKDIWYPGADDLLITTLEPEWVVLVYHDGILARFSGLSVDP